MEFKTGLLALMLFLLPQAELRTINGEVILVQDGDTLTVKTKRDKLYKVRLADIDAPEIVQPFGRAARILVTDSSLN